VYRINFCGGDRWYWTSRNPWNYQDPIQNLDEYLQRKFEHHRFTDVVLFGDMRPVHKPGIRMAKDYGAHIWVFEEGYIRPNYITLDYGGVNKHSSLPRDPTWYRKAGECIRESEEPQPTGYNQLIRLGHDVIYNLARYGFHFSFPSYTLHRPQSPLTEYRGWAKRFLFQAVLRKRHAKRLIDHLLEHKISYFLFPLQLHYDSQVLAHSPFDNIQDALRAVLESFAQNARRDQYLIIKNHPLDIGTIKYRTLLRHFQRQYHLGERIIFIDGGDLPTLLQHCQGTVTINSTTGISALHHGSPVHVLGEAIYNMPGLTCQGTLDDFWHCPTRPNAEQVANFIKVVISCTQINGDFYTKKGIAMAVAGSVKRILFSDDLSLAGEGPSTKVPYYMGR